MQRNLYYDVLCAVCLSYVDHAWHLTFRKPCKSRIIDCFRKRDTYIRILIRFNRHWKILNTFYHTAQFVGCHCKEKENISLINFLLVQINLTRSYDPSNNLQVKQVCILLITYYTVTLREHYIMQYSVDDKHTLLYSRRRYVHI